MQMQLLNIDLLRKDLLDYEDIVNKCKALITENLATNGGTLKVPDIFERDYKWTNLIVAIVNGQIVGFSLIRLSNNMHDLKDSSYYYYISDIVVKKEFRNQGIGKNLMETVIENRSDAPLVASALSDNIASIKLLSKFMKCYGTSRTGKYLRLVDNKSFYQLYGNESKDLLSDYLSTEMQL